MSHPIGMAKFFELFVERINFSVSFGRNLDRDVSLPFSFWTSWMLVEVCISSMDVH